LRWLSRRSRSHLSDLCHTLVECVVFPSEDLSGYALDEIRLHSRVLVHVILVQVEPVTVGDTRALISSAPMEVCNPGVFLGPGTTVFVESQYVQRGTPRLRRPLGWYLITSGHLVIYVGIEPKRDKLVVGRLGLGCENPWKFRVSAGILDHLPHEALVYLTVLVIATSPRATVDGNSNVMRVA